MKRIERKSYLDWLIRWKDRQIIKVVTGVRRCGKSTLFAAFQDHLLSLGVLPEQIISINFEDLSYVELTEAEKLYHYIIERLSKSGRNYVFLDEIQHVRNFERAVDSLFLREDVDIYITGSNGYMLSGELATLLTGRYVELSMLPLSFSEYCSGVIEEGISRQELFDHYMSSGSFPYILRYGLDVQEAREYLSGIYNTVLLNDVVKRLKVSDVNMLESITRFMMYNIGNRTSPSTIANTMTSAHMKIDPKTVDRYIRGLTDSLLFYEVRRYNIKGKRLLSTMNKYYLCDVAFRELLVGGRGQDAGHILENIVYLELRRRYPEVYIGQLGSAGEVDFVAIKDGIPVYYQVALSTIDENVLGRELKPLRQIGDNHPKYLLTLDEIFGEMNYEGVQKRNVQKWLLEKS